jgi:hypothetical protein
LGSDNEKAKQISPLARRGSNARRCASLPWWLGGDDDAGVVDVRGGLEVIGQLLEEQHEVGAASAGAAVLGGDRDAEPAELRHLRVQFGGVSLGLVAAAHVFDREFLGHQRPHAVPQQPLLLGQAEIHRNSSN